MNTSITFLLLFSLLNDIFEFSCQDMLALTCTSRSASASTDLIFVRAVAYPDTFMKSAWYIIAFFCASPSIIAVATSIALALAAIICLALHVIFRSSESPQLKITESYEDAIEMKDISNINTQSKKSSRSLASIQKFIKSTTSPSSSPYTIYIGDLFSSEPQDASPYAIFLGDLFRETQIVSPYSVFLGDLFHLEAQVDIANESPYDVYLGDLFKEESQPTITPTRKMSFADAVGYENMEVCKPRNPVLIGYDVYLGDLFPSEELSNFSPSENVMNTISEPAMTIAARKYSFASLKAQKAEKDLTPIFASTQSVDDLFTIPEENSIIQSSARLDDSIVFTKISYDENKKESKSSNMGYDVYLADLFSESESSGIVPVKMSYADAVGYEFMEVKYPRKSPSIYYDVYLGDLFAEPEGPSIPLTPVKMSYADAVGYEFMESKYPCKSPLVYYDVYLSDLFAEPDVPKIEPDERNEEIDFTLISLLINLVELNIKFYVTYKLTKAILNNRFYKHSPRNSHTCIPFINSKHAIKSKRIY